MRYHGGRYPAAISDKFCPHHPVKKPKKTAGSRLKGLFVDH